MRGQAELQIFFPISDLFGPDAHLQPHPDHPGFRQYRD